MTKESDIQIACNEYLNYLGKYCFFRHFHVPNEGKRSISYHAKMKKMGLKAGVPDFIIEYPQAKLIYIELKTKLGRLSDAQKLWKVQSEVYDTPHYIVKGTLSDCVEKVEHIIKSNIPMKKAS